MKNCRGQMRPLYARTANGFTLQNTTNVRCGAFVIVAFMYDVRGTLLTKVNDEVTTELFYYFFETMCFQTLVACLRSNTLKDVVLFFTFMIVSSSDMLNDELKRRMSSSQSGLTPKAERKGNCFGDSQRPIEHTKQY